MKSFKGHSFHTSRFDYEYTGQDLSKLKDKVVGIIGTGASAVQIIPRVGAASKALYVFQRTPSAIDIRDDYATDKEWAASLQPGWQKERRMTHMRGPAAHGRGIDRALETAARGEDPPAEEPEHRAHDAHSPARRRDRQGQGDGGGAEALVHAPLQAADLRRRVPAGVQPAERAPCAHQRQGHHRDQRAGPGVRGQDLPARLPDLRDRLRRAEDRHLQRHPAALAGWS